MPQGTRSRILAGEPPSGYEYKAESALAEPTPLERARMLDEDCWTIVGDGPPPHGPLLTECGDVRIELTLEAKSVQMSAVRPRTRTQRRAARGTIHITRTLRDKLKEIKTATNRAWEELLDRACDLLKGELEEEETE